MEAVVVSGGAVLLKEVVCPLGVALLSSWVGRKIRLLQSQDDGGPRNDMGVLKILACRISQLALAVIAFCTSLFAVLQLVPTTASFGMVIGSALPFVGSPTLGIALAVFAILATGGAALTTASLLADNILKFPNESSNDLQIAQIRERMQLAVRNRAFLISIVSRMNEPEARVGLAVQQVSEAQTMPGAA